MRINEYQAKKFKDTVVDAANRICPQYGLDPEECIRQAAEATTFGKFALHHNYWNMVGNGDIGNNVIIRVARTLSSENGGCQPQLMSVAKFSSPEAAVIEWCRRNR